MKHFLFLAILCLSCQSTTQETATQPITQTERQIAKDLIQGAFDDLWGGVDSTKISDYHTDDFIILEQGHVWNNDSIKSFMREQLARADRPHRINSMDYLWIDKYGESIQIAYYNHGEFVRADTLVSKVRWLESALAVPTDDGWRLKMMHSTWAGNPD